MLPCLKFLWILSTINWTWCFNQASKIVFSADLLTFVHHRWNQVTLMFSICLEKSNMNSKVCDLQVVSCTHLWGLFLNQNWSGCLYKIWCPSQHLVWLFEGCHSFIKIYFDRLVSLWQMYAYLFSILLLFDVFVPRVVGYEIIAWWICMG